MLLFKVSPWKDHMIFIVPTECVSLDACNDCKYYYILNLNSCSQQANIKQADKWRSMCQLMLEVAHQWGTNYVYSHSHSNQATVLTGFFLNGFSFSNNGIVSLWDYKFSIHFIQGVPRVKVTTSGECSLC